MEQIPRLCTFISSNLAGNAIHELEPGEPRPLEHAMHRRRHEAERRSQPVRSKTLFSPKRADSLRDRSGRFTRVAVGQRGTVVEAVEAFLAVALPPLGYDRPGNVHSAGDFGPRETVLDEADKEESAFLRERAASG